MCGRETFTDSNGSPKRFEVAEVLSSLSCSALPEVDCPYCGSNDLGLLIGKVVFSSASSDDILFDGVPQPLIVVMCVESHIFFLREKDILLTVPNVPVA